MWKHLSIYLLAVAIIGFAGCSGDGVLAESNAEIPTKCNCKELKYDEVYNIMKLPEPDVAFTGTCELWYDEKQIQETRTFANGKMEGVMRKWYANGQLASERNFLNNMQHGELREWDPDGTLRYAGVYQHGKFVQKLEK